MQEYDKFFSANFDMTKNLNRIETQLTAEDVDNNGHVSEVGYLKVANWAYWEICERVGLLKLYNQYGVSGIVFDTHMKFKKEILKGEHITVRLRFSVLSDTRKIIRRLDIFNNENESKFTLTSLYLYAFPGLAISCVFSSSTLKFLKSSKEDPIFS